MGKVEPRRLSRRELSALRKEFEICLLRLPRRQDIVTLLSDLLTPSEQIMVARRLRIARDLLLGLSYLEIRRNDGVGIDTIRMVHHWLDARIANYRAVLPDILARAAAEGAKEKRIGKIPLDPLSFRALRKRYPAHFLLFNLLLGDPDEYELEP